LGLLVACGRLEVAGFMHIYGGCAYWACDLTDLRKLILCIFAVGALIGLALRKLILCIFTAGALIGPVLGRLEEADFVHIYGGCAHWACSWLA
jgi:hypothetical protein